MLDQRDLMQVCSTPDHTHAIVGVSALKSGRHLYCEKPLAHTVTEVRALTEAARQAQARDPDGNQIHWQQLPARGGAGAKRRDCGRALGVWAGAQYGNIGLSETDAPIPKDLDYDLWLGPLAYRPFQEYAPFHWRHFWEFGGGTCRISCVTMLIWRIGRWTETSADDHLQVGKARPERVTESMRVERHPSGARQAATSSRGISERLKILTEAQRKEWKSGVMFVGEKGNYFPITVRTG